MKIFLLLWSAGAFLAPAFGTVGFEQLSVPDPPGKAISAAVWFPSTGSRFRCPWGRFSRWWFLTGQLPARDYLWS